MSFVSLETELLNLGQAEQSLEQLVVGVVVQAVASQSFVVFHT